MRGIRRLAGTILLAILIAPMMNIPGIVAGTSYRALGPDRFRIVHKPTTPLGDVGVHPNMTPNHTVPNVTLEAGDVWLEVGGEESAKQRVVVARVDDGPPLNHDVGGAVATHYEHVADLCFADRCQYMVGLDLPENATKVGELSHGRLQVFDRGNKVSDVPVPFFERCPCQ